MPAPVLVVSIDGVAPRFVRPDTMPHLCALARSGAATFDARTVTPSITLPAHASMLRGVAPTAHGVTSNDPIDMSSAPRSFLQAARDAGRTTAAVLNWAPMASLVEADATDQRIDQRGGYDPAEDSRTADHTIHLLDDRPDVLFTYLVAPDLAGHDAGWGSPDYLDALRTSDSALGHIVHAVGPDTSIVVTTDHGGLDSDHHLGRPEDVRTFVVLRSAGVAPGSRLPEASVLDIAPTVAGLAGFPPDAAWSGRDLSPSVEPMVDHLLGQIASMAEHHYGEDVTMLAHSLQTAAVLESTGATHDLALAGLLHDIGHLLGDAGAWGLPDHAAVGAEYLQAWLPPSIVEPIRLHVDAKRHLVASDPTYTLSEASIMTLRQQGGPFDEAESRAFAQHTFAAAAVALRRADDAGKVAGATPGRLTDWRGRLHRALTEVRPDARELRDRCICPECRDPHSGQRLIGATDLEGWMVAGRAGDNWVLTGPHGERHTVIEAAPSARRPLLESPDLRATATASADGDLGRFREHLVVDGLAIAHGLAPEPGMVIDFATRLGFLRETNYGTLFDVRVESQASNLAYTALGLDLHTDNPYREPVPTVQVLHCLRPAVAGGASIFSDGFRAALALRQHNEEYFRILSGTLVDFEYRSADAVLRAQRPLIDVDPDGSVQAVAVNHRSMRRVHTDHATRWYDAYRAFLDHVNDPAHRIELDLRRGDVVAFDNRRMLHARAAFDPREGRHLQGCYIDIDAVLSAVELQRSPAAI